MPTLTVRRQLTQRTRICLVAAGFESAFGGGMLRFQRYLPGLKARGIDVCCLSGTPTLLKARIAGVETTWIDEPVGKWLPPTTVNGFLTYRVRLPDEDVAARQRLLNQKILEFCRRPETRPDVVQFLSLPPRVLPALLGLRRMGIGTVLTKTIITELEGSRLKRLLLRWFLGVPLRYVDQIVVGSSAMEDSLRKSGTSRPVNVIPHGVNLERFRPPSGPAEREPLRRQLGIPDDHYMLVFVGGVNRRKGIDLLLDAWVELSGSRDDLHLVIVGPRQDQHDPGHAAFHKRLETVRLTSAHPDRVHYVGLVDNPEEYLRAADVFVFPSRREGMPNVMLEAMASGLPVVTTEFLGLCDELGRPGREFLLVDRNAGELAEAIQRLLDNGELRSAMGAAARAWVQSTMDVQLVLDQYAALYRAADRATSGRVPEARASATEADRSALTSVVR